MSRAPVAEPLEKEVVTAPARRDAELHRADFDDGQASSPGAGPGWSFGAVPVSAPAAITTAPPQGRQPGAAQPAAPGQAAAPVAAPLTDQDLQAYLEGVRRTRAPEGTADGVLKARALVSRFHTRSPAFPVLTIPDRVLLIRELLQGTAPADGAAVLDLFTEALPEERMTMLWDVGEDTIRASLGRSPANLQRFDALVRATVDRAAQSLVERWTVDGIRRILERHGDAHVIDDLFARGYRIRSFRTAFDRWRYGDGHTEENELPGLRGNTDRDTRTIRLRVDLTDEEAASTLFHEIRHAVTPEGRTQDEHLEDEISARVTTEEFRIRHGMGPTRQEYRRPDGTVDAQAIRDHVRGSPHYNPTGRRRIGRRYVGERAVTGLRPAQPRRRP